MKKKKFHFGIQCVAAIQTHVSSYPMKLFDRYIDLSAASSLSKKSEEEEEEEIRMKKGGNEKQDNGCCRYAQERDFFIIPKR